MLKTSQNGIFFCRIVVFVIFKGEAMTQNKIAEVQKYITSLPYPCTKAELVSHARNSGATKSTISAISSLPYDYFTTPYDVRDAML